MIEHDAMVGSLLKKVDDLGLTNDTIVIYTSDNGVHMNSWPDGGMTPFRSEKATNWEGAFRVPAMIRWPGHISRDKSPMRSSARWTGAPHADQIAVVVSGFPPADDARASRQCASGSVRPATQLAT